MPWPRTARLLLLTIGVPVLYTTSLVFGILWLLDKDEVAIRRFNKDTRSNRSDGDGFAGLDELEFDFGVVPAPGGGMAGLGVSW